MDASKVAVIVTVFNESSNIVSFLDSLFAQTLSPKEIIIVDGGSTDNTYGLLTRAARSQKSLKVFQVPGNRSVGRNYAIAHTQCPVIAITDAGCLPHPDWLKLITAPFSDPKIQVVSGYYEGRWTNIFQKCLIPYVLVMPDQAGKSEFFPSTRSMALRRSVWLASGGFDTRLSHNEDYAYAHKLKWLGFKFTFVPEALVTWLPRKNLRQAAWMFTRFAIGDIQAGLIRPQVKSKIIRFLGFIFLFFLSLQIPVLFPIIWFLLFLYLVLAIIKNYRYVRDVRALFWLPVLQVTADLSVIFGSAVGALSLTYV